jgi:WD40-like Beta Propeller Repeat
MKPRATKRAAGAVLLPALLFFLAPASPARGQGVIPYYGKNKVKYDQFDWRVYKSPHFEIYYYPEFEQHLARVTSYLESAYQKLSAGLKHELARPIPAILYKTWTEFEQTNLNPGFLPEGVLAFAEPGRGRLTLPIDRPPDLLNGLIQHEMTHIFAFDIIPRTLFQRQIPLWIDEGLASYFEGVWDPQDLMQVRDAAVTEQIPKLSKSDFQPLSGRLVYNLGHAAFEFIESRYGKEGIRQFLYTLRKGILGGSIDDIYQQAFRISADDFDQAYSKWLQERFKPFRDKERPSDYGRNLSPNPEKTPYTQVFAFAPSPSGEVIAALTANRNEGQADIVLLSAKDGSVLRNLTSGLAGDDFESLSFNDDFVAGRTIAFDPGGDTVAFFARKGKRRSLFLVSVLDGSVKKQFPILQDQAQAPCLVPGGKYALFAGLKEGVGDIWQIDLESGEATNLTDDEFFDANPQVSPDGKTVAYARRVSGNFKIYAFPMDDPKKKTQLTFGPFDDDTPIFSSDGNLVYYTSTEDDDIYNLRSLDLRTGAVKQYSDVLGGNMTPAPLAGRGADRLAFISYLKGSYDLHTKETSEVTREIEQDVRVAAEGQVDFVPDVVHQVVPENKRRKGKFEGLRLEGRPPIDLGVTSGGDFFGGTQVALTDIMQDHTFLLTILSVRGYRIYDGQYVNLSRRFQYGLQGFDRTFFFYPTYYIPTASFSRDGVLATQRYRGGLLIGQYPLDKQRRLEVSGGIVDIREQYEDPAIQAQIEQQAAVTGQNLFLNNGTYAPFTVRLTEETTKFANFGPLNGQTFSVGVEAAPPIGGLLSRYTLSADLRKYLRFGSTDSLLALRLYGFYGRGDNPAIQYFGGNNELRGFPYLSFSGNQGFYGNVELRFPLVNLALTPLGLLGPVRGTFFFNFGGAHYKDQPYKFATNEEGISYVNDPIFGEKVSGFRLVDGRASFGFGLQVFLLGYPMHFDWSRLTDLQTVSDTTQFDFWIGFDF